jgi:hypothetical protein
MIRGSKRALTLVEAFGERVGVVVMGSPHTRTHGVGCDLKADL